MDNDKDMEGLLETYKNMFPMFPGQSEVFDLPEDKFPEKKVRVIIPTQNDEHGSPKKVVAKAMGIYELKDYQSKYDEEGFIPKRIVLNVQIFGGLNSNYIVDKFDPPFMLIVELDNKNSKLAFWDDRPKTKNHRWALFKKNNDGICDYQILTIDNKVYYGVALISEWGCAIGHGP